MFLRSRKHRLRMEAIDGYSASIEYVDDKALITVNAHTQSMGSIPLFTGVTSAAYVKSHPDIDFDDIGLEILFDCIDNALTEEITVTPLGQIFSQALLKLDGSLPVTRLEHKVLSAVTSSGITIKILRENGSRVGPEPAGVPRYRAMEHLLERAYPDRPKFESNYEVSFMNQYGETEIAESGLIDDLLDELDAINGVSPE